jgi:hypothetical protein
MGLFFYAVVKFFAYSGYCYAGIRLVPDEAFAHPPTALRRALVFGSLRWLLGTVIGTFVFISLPNAKHYIWTEYAATYIPVRIFEWGAIAVLVLVAAQSESNLRAWRRALLFIAVGIAVSFVTDLASPEWMQRGELCSGRCLC